MFTVGGAPSSDPKPHDLVLFVSCVEGKPVARHNLGGGRASIIGAEWTAGPKLVFHPERIVGISRAEVEAFGGIYDRAMSERPPALVRRKAEEHAAQQAAQLEAHNKIEAGAKVAPAEGATS